MKDFLWDVLVHCLSRPFIADWLIRRAKRRPYTHIIKSDQYYMRRFWLFNPYPSRVYPWPLFWRQHWSWLPSIRLHHIMQPDDDPHLHDHPWDFRTVILKGWYMEDRLVGRYRGATDLFEYCTRHKREPGDTAALAFGQFHQITAVNRSGCWTLFITWKYQGRWGFLVRGHKIPHREYNALRGTTDRES